MVGIDNGVYHFAYHFCTRFILNDDEVMRCLLRSIFPCEGVVISVFTVGLQVQQLVRILRHYEVRTGYILRQQVPILVCGRYFPLEGYIGVSADIQYQCGFSGIECLLIGCPIFFPFQQHTPRIALVRFPAERHLTIGRVHLQIVRRIQRRVFGIEGKLLISPLCADKHGYFIVHGTNVEVVGACTACPCVGLSVYYIILQIITVGVEDMDIEEVRGAFPCCRHRRVADGYLQILRIVVGHIRSRNAFGCLCSSHNVLCRIASTHAPGVGTFYRQSNCFGGCRKG